MPRPRGTGRNLHDAFRLIPALRPDWLFHLYYQRASEREFEDWGPNVRLRRIDIPGDRFGLWLQARLPLAGWLDQLDLIHLPANAAPAWCPVPFVVTIHDLMPLMLEEGQSRRERRKFETDILRGIRRAVQIICPSLATRQALQDRYGVAAERVTVIPWAPDREIARRLGFDGTAAAQRGHETPAGTPQARAEIERVRAAYRLDDDWLLNFSGSSPRKNARGLLRGFARLPVEVRAGLRLVAVGCEPAGFRAQLEAFSRELGIRDRCSFLGFVPHEDLPGLLGGARGLLMPSLCEGFGLPILDAFVAGTPVLTSRLGSMSEVGGAAAAYCDPEDPDDIAKGILEILEPQRAAALRRAGLRRVTKFTWENTARLMCEVYERCLRERGRVRIENDVEPAAAMRHAGFFTERTPHFVADRENELIELENPVPRPSDSPPRRVPRGVKVGSGENC